MTFTGAVGSACMFPLRAIIWACVSLRIHPNILTLTGVIINAWAGWELAFGQFWTAGFIMLLANIFDFIDGKVADELQLSSKFGGFWDSVMDRFSDLFLLIGLIYLYATLNRPDYVLITALTLTFSVMTSYTRARAESEIQQCKVGFMERPERIVLFMIGAFTNRMAGVLWVILVLSILTVLDRIYLTWRELQTDVNGQNTKLSNFFVLPLRVAWYALFWTFDRATWQYDLMVIAILSFVWLTPPVWVGDPVASGYGLLGMLLSGLS